MLPPEDELELVEADIRHVERRLEDLGRERARVVNEPEIGQAMFRLRERLKQMRAYRERLSVEIARDEEERAA